MLSTWGTTSTACGRPPRTPSRLPSCASHGRGAGHELDAHRSAELVPGRALGKRHTVPVPDAHRSQGRRPGRGVRQPGGCLHRYHLRALYPMELYLVLRRRLDPDAGGVSRLGFDRRLSAQGTDLLMPTLPEMLVAAFSLLGTFLILMTGIGLIRFPDAYCRMHAAGKAGTLGVVLVVLGATVHFAGTAQDVWMRGLLAVFFQFLTTPAATHLLAQAAYVCGYPQSELTVLDELCLYLPSRPDQAFNQE